ncbi:hypothetical protein GSI_05355 [Ganoderma sinense ZZ0214-1]|uniref:DUF6533 domain-containing protein n=1 Tax=Ganoderma sinense ZZ0214-1 TaxID=1077348 RepID=A0A2G8SFX9_9APHY|nr:hypothetical protein GSI_05355 [Ganoderma sinense ZZ0214-1]
MSATPVSAQEMADIYGSIYCTYAACAIFLYDWLLCLDQEIRLIWKWQIGVTIFSLLYALSRYALLMQSILAVASN